LKPPFLDGKVIFTKLVDPLNPVKDPTSDMSVVSRKGSLLVKEKREQRERIKAAKSLEVAGMLNKVIINQERNCIGKYYGC